MEYEKPYKYGKSVRISNWQDRMLSYPLDNAHPNKSGASHYRTLGESDLFFIPKTTTQDQLESGATYKTEVRQIAKSQINFVSYPMNDFRFNKYEKHHEIVKTEPMNTTYREVYTAPRPIVEMKDCCEKVLDPLLNRIPKSDFEMLPGSTHKFMDDHLTELSEGRKRINFLRQIRWEWDWAVSAILKWMI